MSHLVDIRNLGPLNKTSAFPFESSFSDLRSRFKAGTSTIPKQILENKMMLLHHGPHSCKKSIKIETKEKMRTDDTLIYTFDTGGYEFFKVKSKSNSFVTARKITVSTLQHVTCVWNTVGVFKFEGVSDEVVSVAMSSIKGKAVIVLDVITSVPYHSLFENK